MTIVTKGPEIMRMIQSPITPEYNVMDRKSGFSLKDDALFHSKRLTILIVNTPSITIRLSDIQWSIPTCSTLFPITFNNDIPDQDPRHSGPFWLHLRSLWLPGRKIVFDLIPKCIGFTIKSGLPGPVTMTAILAKTTKLALPVNMRMTR